MLAVKENRVTCCVFNASYHDGIIALMNSDPKTNDQKNVSLSPHLRDISTGGSMTARRKSSGRYINEMVKLLSFRYIVSCS